MAFCRNCGFKMPDKAVICVRCGTAVAQKPVAMASKQDDTVIRLLIPVGRSTMSIIAGYLGLLSIIPPLGLFALIVGVLAIRDLKKHPEKKGLRRAWFGTIIGGIMTLFYLFNLFFLFIAITE